MNASTSLSLMVSDERARATTDNSSVVARARPNNNKTINAFEDTGRWSVLLLVDDIPKARICSNWLCDTCDIYVVDVTIVMIVMNVNIVTSPPSIVTIPMSQHCDNCDNMTSSIVMHLMLIVVEDGHDIW